MADVLSYSTAGGWQQLSVAAVGTVVASAAGGLAIAAGEVGFDATVGGEGIVNTNGILSVSIPGRGAPTAITTVGAGALTAAAITSGLILRSGPVGAYDDTTDTAVNIIAAWDNPSIGSSFDFTIVNGVAQIGTMLAGVGVTLAGVTANAASKVRTYRCTMTAAATVTITGIGEMVA